MLKHLMATSLLLGSTAVFAAPKPGFFEMLRTKAIEVVPGVASPNFAGSSVYDDTAAGRMVGLTRVQIDQMFAKLRAGAGDADPDVIEQYLATEIAVMWLDRVIRGSNAEHMARRGLYPRYVVPDAVALRAELHAKTLQFLNIDANQLRDPRQVDTLLMQSQLLSLVADNVRRLPQTSIVGHVLSVLLGVAMELRTVAHDLARRSLEAELIANPSLLAASTGTDDEAAAHVLGLDARAWRAILSELEARTAPPARQLELGAEAGGRLLALVLSTKAFKVPTRRYHFYERFAVSAELKARLRAAALGELNLPAAPQGPPTLEQFERLTQAIGRLHSFARSDFQIAADQVLTDILREISPYSFKPAPPAEPGARISQLSLAIAADRENLERQADRVIVERVYARNEPALNAIVEDLIVAGEIRADVRTARRFKWLVKPKPKPLPAARALQMDPLDVDRMIETQWALRDGQTSARVRLRLIETEALISRAVQSECERHLAESLTETARGAAKMIGSVARRVRPDRRDDTP